MPKNTERQAVRRKNAIVSAIVSSFFLLLSTLVLFWLRASLDPAGFGAKLMLVIAVLNLGSVFPIWISLKKRLKEIQGGEEDAASQY